MVEALSPRNWKPALRSLLSEDSGRSLRSRFVNGSVWSLAGSGIAQVMSLLASIATARILGKEQFGELGVVQSTVGLFGTFAGINLGLTAAKFVAEWKTSQPERTGKIIHLSLVVGTFCSALVALVLFAVAPFLTARLLNAPGLAWQLRLGCLLLFVNALSGAQTGALSGFEAFLSIARSTLLRGAATLPIAVVCAWLWGLTGAVLATILAGAIGIVANHYYLLRACRKAGIVLPGGIAISREWRVLWDYSLPAFLAGVISSPVVWGVNALVVNRPNGYSEMGVFNAAFQWRSAFLFLPGVIGQVVMPLVSSLQGESDRRRVRKVLLTSMGIAALVALPLWIGLALFSRQIIAFYGHGFAGHGTVLVLTCTAAALLAIQTPIGNVICGLGKMWMGALMNAGQGLVLLAAAWYFLQRDPGALALAKAYLVSYSAHAIWNFWFATAVISSDESFGPAVKPDSAACTSTT